MILLVESVCPENLFKDAKNDFDEQFPMIQFATAGEETTLDFPLMKNLT